MIKRLGIISARQVYSLDNDAVWSHDIDAVFSHRGVAVVPPHPWVKRANYSMFLRRADLARFTHRDGHWPQRYYIATLSQLFSFVLIDVQTGLN